jgi:hypothetical protein
MLVDTRDGRERWSFLNSRHRRWVLAGYGCGDGGGRFVAIFCCDRLVWRRT